MNQDMPKIAKLGSIKIEVESGKTYYWCSCGLSNSQPFCDGSHTSVKGYAPIPYVADSNKLVSFCGCKYSKKEMICDGSHKILTEK